MIEASSILFTASFNLEASSIPASFETNSILFTASFTIEASSMYAASFGDWNKKQYMFYC